MTKEQASWKKLEETLGRASEQAETKALQKAKK